MLVQLLQEQGGATGATRTTGSAAAANNVGEEFAGTIEHLCMSCCSCYDQIVELRIQIIQLQEQPNCSSYWNSFIPDIETFMNYKLVDVPGTYA